MRLYIKRPAKASFEIHPKGATGSYRIGMGKTLDKAIADFFRAYQRELGIEEIELDAEAMKAEQKRRDKELSKR